MPTCPWFSSHNVSPAPEGMGVGDVGMCTRCGLQYIVRAVDPYQLARDNSASMDSLRAHGLPQFSPEASPEAPRTHDADKPASAGAASDKSVSSDKPAATGTVADKPAVAGPVSDKSASAAADLATPRT